jgi:ribosomal protein S18 acetylase RimI-like enzyme
VSVSIRRLRPGDEDVVARLADAEPRTALLGDDAAIFLVAFDNEEPVGFVLGYLLERRHREARMLFVYELDVAETHRRLGIATRLMRELRRAAGGDEAFVLTDPGNEPANALYASLGGTPSTAVMYEWSPER